MGEIKKHKPALLIAAIISQFDEALKWADLETAKCWGKIEITSDDFDFGETDFYQASMGRGLKKRFVAFQDLIDPARLPSIKHDSNRLEEDFATQGEYPVTRPLNIDPGYISLAKLVLATTKDRDHRIYMNDGIYAEVTLHFQNGSWQDRPWTYPDYKREDYKAFFNECRELLRQKYRSEFAQS